MKKQQLEILLSGLEQVREPDVLLEQYFTPPEIAAEILYIAHGLGDIEGKKVVDLGCGNGIFAIGAALLGAARSVGIDVDLRAVECAKANAEKLAIAVEFFCRDVSEVIEKFDTVIQNPPFGCQNRHADLPFVDKATQIGEVIYSLHHAETERFIEGEFLRRNYKVTRKERYMFPVRHCFKFHRKQEVRFEVVMFRAERGK